MANYECSNLVIASRSGKVTRCKFSQYYVDLCSNDCLFFKRKEVSKNVKKKKQKDTKDTCE